MNQEQYANKIRSQYEERGVTKMDELRALDKKVKAPANIFAYAFGTVGSLVLGTGMCLAMKVIGAALPFGVALGVGVGIVGIGMVSVNYFIHGAILKTRRKKYSDQVMALTDELLDK